MPHIPRSVIRETLVALERGETNDENRFLQHFPPAPQLVSLCIASGRLSQEKPYPRDRSSSSQVPDSVYLRTPLGLKYGHRYGHGLEPPPSYKYR